MGIWQDLFEYRKQLGYYQILKEPLITFTEKLTHNLILDCIDSTLTEYKIHGLIPRNVLRTKLKIYIFSQVDSRTRQPL
jgi:hypothetical protein